ncbi:PQQ-dependent sugar dehydrogenase [Pyxidicoccus sp. 3LFB2]
MTGRRFCLSLRNGIKIPALGLGVFEATVGAYRAAGTLLADGRVRCGAMLLHQRLGLAAALCACALVACSDRPSAESDAGVEIDAGRLTDAGAQDPASDAGEADGGGSADAGTSGDAGTSDAGTALTNSCLGPSSANVANARLPAGYCAWTWATVTDPRGLIVAPNGDVLVVERRAGRITALYDSNSDGVSDSSERATLVEVGGLNHGITLHNGYLYASSATRVLRWPFATGTRAALSGQEEVVTGIPSGGVAGGHVTRTIVFDAEGRLYVSVGSATNVDSDSTRARIRRFTAAQVQAGNVAFTDGEVFADGLRNEVGLRFDSQGRLWGVENERDNLNRADLGGDIHTDNPAEELNLFSEAGRFYGYPYCFSEFSLPAGVGMGPGTQWADPGFMNDGTHSDAWCRDVNNVVPPMLVMPAHVAPLDIVFYDGASFPPAVVGDAFVSFHGSWNRRPAQGYEVARVVFENGLPVRYEPFFEFNGTGDTSADWPHRPVGLGVGPHGELFVSSDASGRIIAIGYQR